MANYSEIIRSNYFQVKDKEAWETFCKRWGLTPIFDANGHGFVLDDGPIRYLPLVEYMVDGETEDDDFDFYLELEQQIPKGEVAIVMAAGSEKMRYIIGFAIAVSPGRKPITIELDEIYGRVKKRWKKKPTFAEY